MTGVDSWSPTKATNAIADGNDSDWVASAHARLFTADLRAMVNDLPWFQYGTGDQGAGFVAVPAVYASGTSFTITGADVTAVYSANRRVRAVGTLTGTIYGSISSSSFASNITTVNVTWDSGSLSNETLVIKIAMIPPLAVPTDSDATGANPTATASDVAVNGSATTFMRSDGAPAVQKCSSSVFGLCKVDGTTISATSGVISITEQQYIVSIGLIGAPLANSQATYVLFEHAVTFPANFGAIASGQSSGATGTANATGSTAFSIDKRSANPGTFGTNIGSITIGAGGITPTFATAGGTSVTTAAGDLWRIIAPSTADATFANLTATLVGTR